MDGTLGEDDWELVILHPERFNQDRSDLARRKRLDKTNLGALVSEILDIRSAPRLGVVLAEHPPQSVLQIKLERGGASSEVVAQATSLKAAAVEAECQHLAAALTGDEAQILEDVRGRLQIRHTSLKELYRELESPAVPLWSDLITHLSAETAQLDRDRVFNKDAYLLLGEICVLADDCLLDFGGDHDEI